MKKLALSLVLCVSGVFAGGNDFRGVIDKIDEANKTITINGYVVQIVPQTRIKLDDCGVFGTDKSGKFLDLKQGEFVKVKMSSSTPPNALPSATNAPAYIAQKVELKCVRNPAY